jgi:hypothetical protein
MAQRAFTYMELAVAVAILAVIMVSLGSVIVAASKAMPAVTASSDSNSTGADAVADQMMAELRFATGISESTPTAVTFTVPDRNNDNVPETIRYAWSGVAGDPLTRAYNGGAPVAVVPGVSSLALQYLKHKYTSTTTGTTVVNSGEVQFSGFTSWSGITGTSSNGAASTTSWCAETFVIDRVAIPSDATRIAITRVSLKIKKPASGTAGCTVGIYLPSAAGSTIPASTPIGSICTIPDTALTTAFAWVDSTFTDVAWANPSQTTMIILVKGVASTTTASIQYLNAAAAPTDNSVFRWTTNSGTSWQPTSGLNANDAVYAVYGTYQRNVTSTISVDTYTLGSVALMLQPSALSSPRIDTAIEVLNEPSIAGP